ncbi:MAG: hypothetical protein P8144_12920 [Gammaproteobacteria bacterium]
MTSSVSCLISKDKGLSVVISQENAPDLPLECVKSVWYRRLCDPLEPSVDTCSNEIDPRVTYVRNENMSLLGTFFHVLKDRLWLPDMVNERSANYKPVQLALAVKHGFDVPETWIGNAPSDVVRFISELECVEQFALKGLHRGGYTASPPALKQWFVDVINRTVLAFSKRKLYVETNLYGPTEVMDCTTLLAHVDAVRHCPIQIQRYIDKCLELRITVIGDRIFACSLDSQKVDAMKHDWRSGTEEEISKIQAPFALPTEIQDRCLEFMRALGLNFGCIDMILTPDDQYVFLEINPNGQWAWLERDLGFDISGAIADLLIEAD